MLEEHTNENNYANLSYHRYSMNCGQMDRGTNKKTDKVKVDSGTLLQAGLVINVMFRKGYKGQTNRDMSKY